MRKVLLLFLLPVAESLVVVKPYVSILPHAPASFGRKFSDDELGVGGWVTFSLGDGCSPSSNNSIYRDRIVLIPRGNCPFVDKVMVAQNSGALASIVFGHESIGYQADELFTMGTHNESFAEDINIPAVFISFNSFRLLDAESSLQPIWIVINNTGISDPANSGGYFFGGLFRLSVVLWCFIGCFYLYNFIRKKFASRKRLSVVRKLPTRIYNDGTMEETLGSGHARVATENDVELQVMDSSSVQVTDYFDCGNCVICICDFDNGDAITVLPCGHGYHKECIEPWLIKKSALCPICKQSILPSGDARSLDEISATNSEENSQGNSHNMLALVFSLVGTAFVLAFINQTN